MNRGIRFLLMSLLVIGCFGAAGGPAELQRGESCRWCRMAVSDARFAAQLSGAELLFFDDIGCMQHFLSKPKEGAVDPGSVPYVADHRTKEWIHAAAAEYRRCPGVETPMSSHLVAWRDVKSAGLDPAAAGCTTVSAKEIFGATLPGGEK